MINYRKLDGWQRLGVVLFVLWILLVTFYCFYELANGSESKMLVIHMKEIRPGSVGSDGVFRFHPVTYKAYLVPWRVILAALAPPFFIGSSVAVITWVMAGFRQ